MKYIISERQYNFMIEQSDSRMPFQPETFGLKQGKPETVRPSVEKQKEFFKSVDPHTVLMITGIASAFIPLVGPFAAAGIGLVDAALYAKQGDPKTAGMIAMFSLIPGVGSIVNRIPVIRQLGVKGMSDLAQKLSKGQKITDPIELQVINGIKENVDLIKSALDTHVKTLAQQASTKPFSSVIKSGLLKLGKEGLKTLGLGVGYDVGYDLLNPQIDLNSISVDKVSDVNKKASQEIKYN